MSLDLNKLGNKLDEALSNETTETLTKFLTNKRMSNNKQNLGTLTYVTPPTIVTHKIENVEWVFQFNDDEPIFLAEPSPYGGGQKK